MNEEHDKDSTGNQHTGDEMRRNMEFILQQQARFSAGMEELREAQRRNDLKWEKTEEGIRALLAIAQAHEQEIQTHEREIQSHDERIDALIKAAELHTEAIQELREAMQVHSEFIQEHHKAMQEHHKAIEEQREAGRATDERLNALINFFERYISGRRGDDESEKRDGEAKP